MKIGLGPMSPFTALRTLWSETGQILLTTPRWSVAWIGSERTVASSSFCITSPFSSG